MFSHRQPSILNVLKLRCTSEHRLPGSLQTRSFAPRASWRRLGSSAHRVRDVRACLPLFFCLYSNLDNLDSSRLIYRMCFYVFPMCFYVFLCVSVCVCVCVSCFDLFCPIWSLVPTVERERVQRGLALRVPPDLFSARFHFGQSPANSKGLQKTSWICNDLHEHCRRMRSHQLSRTRSLFARLHPTSRRRRQSWNRVKPTMWIL